MQEEHKILQFYRKFNEFGRYLGAEFAIDKSKKITYSLHITKNHIATPMHGHGGVVAALMDCILGVEALVQVVDEMRIVSTVEFKINFFSPVYLGDILTSTSKTLKKGKRLIFVEGEIYNQKGELVAKGNGTMNAYDSHKAKFEV